MRLTKTEATKLHRVATDFRSAERMMLTHATDARLTKRYRQASSAYSDVARQIADEHGVSVQDVKREASKLRTCFKAGVQYGDGEKFRQER